jgi:hypothetical protein
VVSIYVKESGTTSLLNAANEKPVSQYLCQLMAAFRIKMLLKDHGQLSQITLGPVRKTNTVLWQLSKHDKTTEFEKFNAAIRNIILVFTKENCEYSPFHINTFYK